MQSRNAEIAVILAALNEESGIGPTIAELQSVLVNPHLIVVDGRSTDKTIEVARNLGADIAIQSGLGKGDAMSHGLRQLHPNSRYVVFTDADLRILPSLFLRWLKFWSILRILVWLLEIGLMVHITLIDLQGLYSILGIGSLRKFSIF